MLNAVPFNYFGKQRNLKFGLDAMRNIERETGISLQVLLSSNERLGVNALCVIIANGLRHEDNTMTADKVSRWIEKYIGENEGENLLTVMANFETDILEAFRLSGLFGSMKVNDDGEWQPKNEQAEEAKTEQNPEKLTSE